MRAKFNTEDCLSECYKYTAPQALGAIILGLVIAVLGLVAGITVVVCISIPGGSMLLVSLELLALIILYYGFIGANKMVKSNTILVNTKTKETIITDENVLETSTGEGIHETREFGYDFVSSARYSKGMFVLYLTDGTSVLCSADKIVEGDINEMRIFLKDKFGKQYVDKTFVAQVGVAEGETHEQLALNSDNEQENAENEQNVENKQDNQDEESINK